MVNLKIKAELLRGVETCGMFKSRINLSFALTTFLIDNKLEVDDSILVSICTHAYAMPS